LLSREKKPPDSEPVRPCYSIVVPFYNEVDSVEEFHRRCTAVMDKIGKPYEMVFVNDGSTDGTQQALQKLTEVDGRVVAVELRRNFGQTPALVAGFDQSRGDVIISMDGDLQHAPEDIPEMLKPLQDGYDLISGWRKCRVDNFILRRLPSLMANRLMRTISGVEIHDFGTTFKVYRRDLLEHIRLYGEHHRFIPALASAVGARICEVPIQNIVRPKGKSKYGIGRTVRVLMDLLTIKFLLSYITRPLHFMGIGGLVTFVIGAGIEAWLVVEKILRGWNSFHLMQVRGPLLTIGIFLMTVSLIFFVTGLLGELMVRTYYEAQGKRTYVVRKVWRKGNGA
jgi:glycosyltransferase involved in cell wall biosynthesis